MTMSKKIRFVPEVNSKFFSHLNMLISIFYLSLFFFFLPTLPTFKCECGFEGFCQHQDRCMKLRMKMLNWMKKKHICLFAVESFKSHSRVKVFWGTWDSFDSPPSHFLGFVPLGRLIQAIPLLSPSPHTIQFKSDNLFVIYFFTFSAESPWKYIHTQCKCWRNEKFCDFIQLAYSSQHQHQQWVVPLMLERKK